MLCVAFYICFFIQYCYFWYVHGISCCVIFCCNLVYSQVSFRGFALCYLHCCCVHSCTYLSFFGTCVEVSVCILRKRDRERKIGKEKGERQGGRERKRRREEFLGRRLYMSSVLLIIAKLLSKVIAPVTLPSCSPLPMLF